MDTKQKEITRIDVVQKAIDKLGATRYLEVGVHSGSSFLNIHAPRKFAVDPFFQISPQDKKCTLRRDWKNIWNKYYEMTSDEFFETKKNVTNKKFDVALLDGLHTYEQTLKDAINTIDCLNDHGVIVLHDCFPPFEAAAFPAPSLEAANKANPPGWTGEWCGDVWKVILNLRSQRKDVEAFVFDTDKGLGIITKKKPSYDLNYSLDEINSMTYKDLMENPQHYIGLRDISELDEFISNL